MTKVVVFGYDVAEASQIRRIRTIAAAGYDVTSFTMRRRNMNLEFRPEWRNVHLFETTNENFGRRTLQIALSVFKTLRHWRLLRAADVVIARNLDMLAIAWASMMLAGARKPLAYECLDINGTLTQPNVKGRILRSLERFLLRRTNLLVLSSPGFVREYFEPIQHHTGPVFLIENKLAISPIPPPRPSAPKARAPGEPLTLGWIGLIRCAPSFRLLLDVADVLGPLVRLRICGVIHRNALPDFDEEVARRVNVSYEGPYSYPSELSTIYGACDLVWAQDLWQRGTNSDWLLPNRIYEASWCGCPSIAVSDTETGRRIEADGLGYTITSPDASVLAELLQSLSQEEISAKSAAVLALPDSRFLQSPDEIPKMIETLRSLR